MQLECPNCNCELNLDIILKIKQKEEQIYKTRLEMAEENAKPIIERQWGVIEYDAKRDRFLVQKVRLYNDN